MAQKVTRVFEKYPHFLNKKVNSIHMDKDFFGVERVKFTESSDESKAIEAAPAPKIIIAGSGMINGGRILFHLKNYISDPKNTLLIVGYQAQGTLGRKLFEGEKTIRIFGKSYPVNASVKAIGSYSAHADAPQLEAWISKIADIKKVFLVHGETNEALALSKRLKQNLGHEVVMPQLGEESEL